MFVFDTVPPELTFSTLKCCQNVSSSQCSLWTCLKWVTWKPTTYSTHFQDNFLNPSKKSNGNKIWTGVYMLLRRKNCEWFSVCLVLFFLSSWMVSDWVDDKKLLHDFFTNLSIAKFGDYRDVHIMWEGHKNIHFSF